MHNTVTKVYINHIKTDQIKHVKKLRLNEWPVPFGLPPIA